MDKFLISGPCKIKGQVAVSASKNAALPILASTLLFDKPVVIENLPRVITKNLYAHVNLNNWKLPPLFKWLMSMGITEKEMLKTFNCGYGMIAIIDKKNMTKFNTILKKYRLKSTLIGELKNKKKNMNRSVLFSGSL